MVSDCESFIEIRWTEGNEQSWQKIECSYHSQTMHIGIVYMSDEHNEFGSKRAKVLWPL